MKKSIISIILFISTFCVGSTVWAGGITLPPHSEGCTYTQTDVAYENTDYFPTAEDPADNCDQLCGGWKQMCDGLSKAAGDCIKDSAGAARKLAAQQCNQLTGADKKQCKKALVEEIAYINDGIKDDTAEAKEICAENKEYCIMSCEDGDSSSE